MLAHYFGTTYRRRRIRRDLAEHGHWLRGRLLQIGGEGDLGTYPHVDLDAFPHYPTTVAGSADALPFEDESFDTILAVEVFEHLPHPTRAIHECARVLRHDGVLVITAPFMWPVHNDWRAPYYDYTRWTDSHWRDSLLAAGFFPDIQAQGGLLAVILEGAKAMIRRWPKPYRYVGYFCFPILDALFLLDRPCRPVYPAGTIFTSGWLIHAVRMPRCRTA